MPALKKRITSSHVTVAVVLLFLVLYFVISYFSIKDSVPSILPENPAFRNASLETEVRINDLLSHMTLEEKIGQMALIEKNSLEDINDIPLYGLGALLSGFGGKPENNTKEGWKRMVNDYIAV